MKSRWILVANASLARIFRRDSAVEPLVPVETLSHEEGRMRGSELASDRPGTEATDNSRGANRFEPRTDARRKEHLRFAREIADRLDKELAAHEFDSLAVFASNPFCGELRAQLSEGVEKRIKLTHNNDFTSLDLAALEKRLAAMHGATS
ncbi:MAG TPA: host attachment protein [Ramlibacter sp.]|nr:host attachment protein [Ramlibacter sp.]